MPTVNVNIQPAIINWALSQTSEEMLGAKLMENIKHWLDGTKSPTFNQIEDFSKKSHIPLGYFFLKEGRSPSFLDMTLTSYPLFNNSSAMHKPMPLVPPVINAFINSISP